MRPDPWPVRAALTLYRGLLALLPHTYGERHGGDAHALMAELARSAYRERGAAGCAAVTLAAATDAILRLPAEYVRIGALGGDLWFALRSLRRNRLSTAAAIATLAVGIGLNAAVFTVVDWVLFRPLPYPAADQLVRVWTAGLAPVTAPADVTPSELQVLGAARSLQAVTAYSVTTRVVAGDRVEPFHAVVARLAGDWFATFGVSVTVGRGMRPDEAASGAAVAVISDSAWRRRFFGDPSIVGRTMTIDRKPFTIVGVMPPNQGFPTDADVWRPLTAAEREDDDRELAMFGRLQKTTAERASVELATLASGASRAARRAWAEDLRDTRTRGVRAALVALWASAAVVLLMACANVIALMSARGVERASELAVRSAIGASRARIAQQLVTESLVLSAAGGAAGLVLAQWALETILLVAPAGLPRVGEIALDGRIVGGGVAVTCLIGVVVGAVTAWRLRPDLQVTFTAAPAASRTGTQGNVLRALVAFQTAVAVVLTVTAVLFARGLQRFVAIDHGIAADRLIAVDLNGRGGGAANDAALFRDLIDAATAVPGVRTAAVSLRGPHLLPGPRAAVRAEGAPATTRTVATLRPVSRGYFETVGVAITSGRGFEPRDGRGAPHVAIVNETFARDVLRRADAVGTTLTTDVFDDPVTIIGMAKDVTPAGEHDRPALYISLDQLSIGGGTLLVRTDGDPRGVMSTLAGRLRSAAPALALDRIQRVAESLEAGRSAVRFTTQLASVFAALALVLAVVAVYGLTAGEVMARWRELAIRLALGATRWGAVAAVVRPGMTAVIAGTIAGVAGAIGASRWIASRMPEVGLADRATLAAVPAILAAIGLVAAAFAARRVVRANPAATLRGE